MMILKRIYKADGDAHSWEWLAMISPCVDVLRNLARQLNDDLGSSQGSRQSKPDLTRDIALLMQNLDDLDVYRAVEGRVLDPDEMPVPDALSFGLSELTHGPAITDYNIMFDRNRERRRLQPLSNLLTLIPPTSTDIVPPQPATISPIPTSALPSHETYSNTQAVQDELQDELQDINSASSDDEELVDNELVLVNGDNLTLAYVRPLTFSLLDAADVSLDMDEGDEVFEDEDVYEWDDVLAPQYSDASESGEDTDIEERGYKSV